MCILLEMEKGEVKLSPAMSEIVKAVQQSKWTLMRTRQQLSRGYKEVRSQVVFSSFEAVILIKKKLTGYVRVIVYIDVLVLLLFNVRYGKMLARCPRIFKRYT